MRQSNDSNETNKIYMPEMASVVPKRSFVKLLTIISNFSNSCEQFPHVNAAVLFFKTYKGMPQKKKPIDIWM
jgi:hypothetical protein